MHIDKESIPSLNIAYNSITRIIKAAQSNTHQWDIVYHSIDNNNLIMSEWIYVRDDNQRQYCIDLINYLVTPQ